MYTPVLLYKSGGVRGYSLHALVFVMFNTLDIVKKLLSMIPVTIIDEDE